MAGGTVFGGLVKRPHDGFGMAVEVGEDFSVGDRARNGSAALVDQRSGNSHHVASRAGGVRGHDGVADGATDAFIFKGPLLRHSLRKVA